MLTDRDSFSTNSWSRYMATIRRWWWVLVGLPLIAAVFAYVFSARQPKSYTAQATLFVSQASSSSSDVTAAKLLTKSYNELVTSRPVMQRASDRLSGARTVDQLDAQVKTKIVPDTQVIQINVDDSDPQMAANIANATGEEFVAWIAESQAGTNNQSIENLNAKLEEARSEIDKINAQLTPLLTATNPTQEQVSQRAQLQDQLRLAQTTYTNLLDIQQRQEFTPQGRVVLAQQATPSNSPDGPYPLRNAIIAFILDALLLAAGIFAFERLRNRVQLPDDIQRNAELPMLATIPRSRRKGGVEIVEAPGSLMSESIRSLRTALQFAAHNDDLGTLLVTSPGQDEGKSMVAANLAVALAQIGKKVVLIDGDMRRPSQGDLFNVHSRNGFAELLSQPNLKIQDALAKGPVAGLQIITTNKSDNNPAELLSGRRFRNILTELKQEADVIILDGPPLLAVSDAMLLAAESDNAVLIAETGQTRSDALRAARTTITQTGVNVLGVVLNGTKSSYLSSAYIPYDPGTSSSFATAGNGQKVGAARDREMN